MIIYRYIFTYFFILQSHIPTCYSIYIKLSSEETNSSFNINTKMSIFQSDPASCGPSNALTNLNKFANQDNSLSNQFIGSSHHQGNAEQQNVLSRNNFNSINENLQYDFNQFNQQHQQPHQSFSNSGFIPQQQQQQQQHQSQFQNQANSQWINDFQKMNINNIPQEEHIQQLRQANQQGWINEFQSMQQMDSSQHQQQQMQQQNQQHQQQYNSNAFQMRSNMMLNNSSMMYDQQQRTNLQQQQSNIETDDMYDMFEQVENELNELKTLVKEEEKQKEEEMNKDESEKILFAQIAKNVFNTMNGTNKNNTINSNTSQKFQNSNFLKLMQKIGERKIEINNEGNKFIDENGNDIRDYLPDPLKDLKDSDLSYENGAYKNAEIVMQANSDNTNRQNPDNSGSLRPGHWDEVFEDA